MCYKDSVVPPSHLHHLEKSKHWHNQLFEVYQVHRACEHAKHDDDDDDDDDDELFLWYGWPTKGD